MRSRTLEPVDCRHSQHTTHHTPHRQHNHTSSGRRQGNTFLRTSACDDLQVAGLIVDTHACAHCLALCTPSTTAHRKQAQPHTGSKKACTQARRKPAHRLGDGLHTGLKTKLIKLQNKCELRSVSWCPFRCNSKKDLPNRSKSKSKKSKKSRAGGGQSRAQQQWWVFNTEAQQPRSDNRSSSSSLSPPSAASLLQGPAYPQDHAPARLVLCCRVGRRCGDQSF